MAPLVASCDSRFKEGLRIVWIDEKVEADVEIERERAAAREKADGQLTMPRASQPPDRRYNGSRWRRIAKLQLLHHPMCAHCAERGLAMPAVIADHIIPVRSNSDPNAFWLTPLQSLCFACHNAKTGFEDKHGFRRDIGLDGMPIDERHPVYRPRRQVS